MTVSFPQVFEGVIWAVPHHSIPCSASRPALTREFVHMENLLSLAFLFMFKLFQQNHYLKLYALKHARLALQILPANQFQRLETLTEAS